MVASCCVRFSPTSSTLLVEAAIYFGYAILVGSGLGFLGMGVQPPSPDWGLQVSDGRNLFAYRSMGSDLSGIGNFFAGNRDQLGWLMAWHHS